MDSNTEWLKTIFAQPTMSHIELEESFNCKWFYVKHGRAFYNPKQAAIAHPLEFKYHCLGVLYEHMKELKKPG